MEYVHVYPPLGTLTGVHEPVIRFRIYIVSDAQTDYCAAESELWSNMYGAGWQSVALKEDRADDPDTHGELAFLDTAHLKPGASIQHFYLDVDAVDVVDNFEFTARWRTAGQHSGDWHWVGGFGHNANVVVYRPLPDSYKVSLGFWQRKLKLVLEAAVPENHPDMPLVPIADSWRALSSGASCLVKVQNNDIANGKLPFCRLGDVRRYLAFVRSNACWIDPRSGTSSIDTGGLKVVVLLIELGNGAYAAFMPFTRNPGLINDAVFSPGDSNHLYLRPAVVTGCTAARVAVSISKDPHEAIDGIFAQTQEALPSQQLPQEDTKAVTQDSTRSLSTHLGYCTWNAFYREVTHDKIVTALTEIHQKSAETSLALPAWVIIDDGWQMVDVYDTYGRLYDIHANGKFPGQLKHTIDALTPLGIGQVGVWHTLWGYWGGIDPKGPLSQRYELVKCHRMSSSVAIDPSDLYLIAPQSVYEFYDEFYAWLREQGVSFVKVDYQGAFDTLDGYADKVADEAREHIAKMCAAYYDAMETAAWKYFGAGKIIYCMSHTPYLITRILKRQQEYSLGAGKDQPPLDKRMLFRNSDDYCPERTDAHGWHIYRNVANMLWSRQLSGYISSDWDMFQPGRPESPIHAASRALSGGPIYITATGNDFKPGWLDDIVGRNGSVAAHLPPRIDSRCLFDDMTKVPAILVANIAMPRSSAVVVAAFNVFSSQVIAPVFLRSIYASEVQFQSRLLPPTPSEAAATVSTDALVGEYFSIYQHSTARLQVSATVPITCALALLPLSCDILTVTRMTSIRSSDRSAVLHASCIGEPGRYAGAAIVVRNIYSVLVSPESNMTSCQDSLTLRHGQRQWNIRVRVSSSPRQLLFAVYACEATADAAQLPVTIQAVRASRCKASDVTWTYDSDTGALTISLNTRGSAPEHKHGAMTVTINISA
ncbi:hypothetical protein H4R20_000999 [Coemansia guatemalensis]|uniref:Alpha-galactosidase n=1 Tax=Coemansia guatemalensis TaxID=2761395 RepID=A0A9W8HY69_9FUNG|nr:hypothetical protein H4R20_000999 [Coemansia guatemalensis]